MSSCLQVNFYSHLCTSSMSFPYLLFKRIIQMNHNRTNHTIIPTRLSVICIYIYLCVLECVSVCPIHIRIWKSSIHWREKISLVLLVPNCWSYIVIEYEYPWTLLYFSGLHNVLDKQTITFKAWPRVINDNIY